MARSIQCYSQTDHYCIMLRLIKGQHHVVVKLGAYLCLHNIGKTPDTPRLIVHNHVSVKKESV